MRSLVKFLVLALIIVFVGLWIMTVAKSCEKTDQGNLPDIEAGINDEITEVTDDVEDLFEEDEESQFNEEGDEIVSNGSETTSDEIEGESEEENDKAADLEAERIAREEAANRADSNGSESSSSTSNITEYLVISGAFLTEANAKKEVERLKTSSFIDAEVVIFNSSKYHSVCAQRTSSLREANRLRDSLKSSGYNEAYVHKKRRGKKK